MWCALLKSYLGIHFVRKKVIRDHSSGVSKGDCCLDKESLLSAKEMPGLSQLGANTADYC
jgi:hypothetical protein